MYGEACGCKCEFLGMDEHNREGECGSCVCVCVHEGEWSEGFVGRQAEAETDRQEGRSHASSLDKKGKKGKDGKGKD